MLDATGPPAIMRGMSHPGYRVLHWELGALFKVCGSAMKVGGFVAVFQHPSTMSAGLFLATFAFGLVFEVSALIASTQRTIARQLASACAGPRHMMWLSAL